MKPKPSTAREDPAATPARSPCLEWFVSPEGDDSAEGGQRSPLRTPGAALARARPGSVLHLAPGSYGPVVASGVCGTAEHPIVIRGEGTMPIDWTTIQEVDREMFSIPIREALDAGRLSLGDSRGIAVIEGRGHPVGFRLDHCEHLVIENLAVRDAFANLEFHASSRVLVRDCVVTGDPSLSQHGVVMRLTEEETEPNRFLRFERVLAYGMKENGFRVDRGAACDVEWECCLAHGMQSLGGDGFSFGHVKSVPGSRHDFPDGWDARMTLVRCVAMRNRLDGFDIGHGVRGMTLQGCFGDSNGWAEYYARDLKVWSGGNVFRRCRMTGRAQFVSGTSLLEDFRAGTKPGSPEAL